MKMGSPIDWDEAHEMSEKGRLMELLFKIPRANWMVYDGRHRNLIHYAARGPNLTAMKILIKSSLDVNAIGRLSGKPAHVAARKNQPRALELLCAVGAEMRESIINISVLEYAFRFCDVNGDACVRVLIANGNRINTVGKFYEDFITPDLKAFEHGIFKCRTAVVAMIRVKRAGKLWNWDKFLLKEIAICVWATRYDEEWTV